MVTAKRSKGKTIAIVIVALLLACAITINFFDWNLLRGYISRKVSDATGRTFAINGDLDVRLSLRPRIIANDIAMGNATWSNDPNMAEIGQLDFKVDLLSAVRRHWVFPEITLSRAKLVLEKSAEGVANWDFAQEGEKQPGAEIPSVGSMIIDQGKLTYRDPAIGTDLTVNVDTVVDGSVGQEQMVDIAGRGTYQGMSATVNGRIGALLSLRNRQNPYPLKISVALGETKATAEGFLIDPLRMKGQDIDFRLEGRDLALLFPIVGVPIPPTPSYRISGHLTHEDELWTLRKLSGKVGRSDIAGNFSIDRGQKPQFIKANLTSSHLDMEDLGGFVGGDRGDRPSPVERPDRVLPSEPFSLEKLRTANAVVNFRGEKITNEKVPIKKMHAHLVLQDGVLKLNPLDFEVAGGNLVSTIEMDARQQTIHTRADIRVKRLQLDKLLPETKLTAANIGTLGGRAKLAGKGNSLAAILGSANGEAALIVDGGTISELIMRLSNLDIANSVARLIGGDKQIPIRCMVGHFHATEGDFTLQTLVLDTPKVNLTGSGNINLEDESLNLRLKAKGKGFSLASFRGPIDVQGTLKNPIVLPDMGKVIGRGAAAAALGAVTAGIGAFLPLIEFGKEEDSNCTALIGETKADAGVSTSDTKPKK